MLNQHIYWFWIKIIKPHNFQIFQIWKTDVYKIIGLLTKAFVKFRNKIMLYEKIKK